MRLFHTATLGCMIASGCSLSPSVVNRQTQSQSNNSDLNDESELSLIGSQRFDRNQDGFSETSVLLQKCQNADDVCVALKSSEKTEDLVRLPANVLATRQRITSNWTVMNIGDHGGGGSSPEFAVIYVKAVAQGQETKLLPTLAVVDIDDRRILTEFTIPTTASMERAFFSYVIDENNKRYPFIAPGYGDYEALTGYYAKVHTFAPKYSSNNWVTTSLAVPSVGPCESTFREAGGYALPHQGVFFFIYHCGGVAADLLKGRAVHSIGYDVAASQTQKLNGMLFHSGRNYGVHRTINLSNGDYVTAIISGQSTGQFENIFCSVSRWYGVLKGNKSDLSKYGASWFRYSSFHSNTFALPEGRVMRKADGVNGCLHYVDDGIGRYTNGFQGLMFNRFVMNDPQKTHTCETEQLALYKDLPQGSLGFEEDKYKKYKECMRQNLQSIGRWNMEFVSLDGKSGTGSRDTYVYGSSSRVNQEKLPVYFVEDLDPAGVPFNLNERNETRLRALRLKDGKWEQIGSRIPVAGRPSLSTKDFNNYSTSAGAYLGRAEICQRDLNKDGFVEIEIRNTKVDEVFTYMIGFDQNLNDWTVRTTKRESSQEFQKRIAEKACL